MILHYFYNKNNLHHSQLQGDLKTTNMQEMKITVETYYEEVTSIILRNFCSILVTQLL